MHMRPANEDDSQETSRLIKLATEAMEEPGIHQWDDHYPTLSEIQTDLNNRTLYVAESQGTLVGILTIDEQQPREYAEVSWRYPGRVLVVHRLAVHPASQRRGVASSLMDFAENLAATSQFDTIRLDAFSHNPAAVALYSHRGYRNAGTVNFRKGKFYCYEKRIPKRRDRRDL